MRLKNENRNDVKDIIIRIRYSKNQIEKLNQTISNLNNIELSEYIREKSLSKTDLFKLKITYDKDTLTELRKIGNNVNQIVHSYNLKNKTSLPINLNDLLQSIHKQLALILNLKSSFDDSQNIKA